MGGGLFRGLSAVEIGRLMGWSKGRGERGEKGNSW